MTDTPTTTLAVFTTIDSEDGARDLARRAVSEKLAACVQITAIASVYDWDGLREEPEWRVLFKTTKDGYAALEEMILDAHPYDEPSLWAHEIAAGSGGYLAWIAETVG
ncbi:divalent-cation tolerance protein CutA [Roseivivax marinus]|jgi:periplasmic divalent cation tolerance protein|uniref:divalent-cation tolerance protein CutA n=1 Tax=Roseivivax marinus TaxID=1379903 RepID=UPI00273D4A95|nr:divalent-cation tolerance protein CutA [Roseivivax marinus]